MTPEMVFWNDKATDAYWRARIYKLLAQVGNIESMQWMDFWYALLDDMYGDELGRKKELVELILANDKVSVAPKKWVRTL